MDAEDALRAIRECQAAIESLKDKTITIVVDWPRECTALTSPEVPVSRLLKPPPDEAVPPDDAVLVRGTEQSYECPDIAAVDAHLKELSDRVKKAGAKFPKLTAAYRADQDKLLARRMYLVLITATGEEPPQ